MAGFIKTVMALTHKQIPPLVNFTRPSSALDLPETPFVINTALQAWAGPSPRVAGITALGAGGTNAHVLVEEAPNAPASSSSTSRPTELVLLSAKSAAALEQATKNLTAYLAPERSPPPLADVAYTLALGRKAFAHRRIVVGRDGQDVAAALTERAATRVFTNGPVRGAPPVVFMFAGGGAQHAGMGAELYQHEPRYRAIIDQGAAHMKRTAGIDLLALMYPSFTGTGTGTGADEAAASKRLEAPSLALPTLFATEYALASLLMSWGITPDAMIGHSMGEYVAACLAGVLSYEAALSLVSLRGRLFETLAPGGMLSVSMAEAEVRSVLAADRALSRLSIAAVNAPKLCVVSGANEAISALEALLTAREIDTARIHIAVPAHSEMLSPILPEFERHCRTITFAPPKRRYVSNLTGEWITAAEATNPRYWVDHLRHTVKFSAGLASLGAEPTRVHMEVGPGRTLTSLVRAQLGGTARTVQTLPHPSEPESALAFFQTAVGRLWTYGADVDWQGGYGTERRRRVPLPTYPFERKRHWFPRPKPAAAATTPPEPKTAAPPRRPPAPDDWFSETDASITFDVELSRERHWLLGEHVIRGGEALVPGTGFLELARAALGAGPAYPEGEAVLLTDVVFLSPFVVRAGQPRRLRVTLEKRDGQLSFESDGVSEAEIHVTGRATLVKAASQPKPVAVDLAALHARCPQPGKSTDGFLDQSFMDFGPRWANVARIGHGEAEAVVELVLPDAFAGDLASYPLHPALLDMATGCAQALIPGFDPSRDFFVPFSYGRVLARRPLPPRLVSHVRYRASSTRDTAIFDVTLLDEHGSELVSITDFTMKRGRGAFETSSAMTRDEGLDTLARILAPRPAAHVVASSPARHADIADWFYRWSWRSSPRTPVAPTPAGAPRGTLIFCDRGGLGAALGARLEAQGRPVILVEAGAAFARSPTGTFVIDPSRSDDYVALLRAVAEQPRPEARTLSSIVHLWSADESGDARDPAALARAQELGFFSLLYLAQAMATEDISGPLDLSVIASDVTSVQGESVESIESVAPAKATVLGPVRVIPRELPGVTCRLIDVRRAPAGSPERARTIDQVGAELIGGPTPDQVIAYRGADRLVQTFEPVRLQPAGATQRLRKGGVYLITGGLGGLGLTIAERLARRFGAKLVLMGRQTLPAPAEWNAWLTAHDDADPVSRRIRKLREIESLGAELYVVGADVTRPDDVRRVVHETQRRFGALHGVFHTAGVLDDGVIALKARTTAEAVLAPKVAGTIALDRALDGITLDFFVLFSSISSLCGLTGQVDYAAANAFLDAFAQDRTSRNKTKNGGFTLSINWSGWREVGMAAELARQLGVGAGGSGGSGHHALANNQLEVTFRDGMLPDEGAEALERMLGAAPLPQLVVTPTDLKALFARLSSPPPATETPDTPAKPRGRDLSPLEEALANHEVVSEAAARELEERPGERRIVAYVVYKPGEQLTVSEVRRFLRGKVGDDLIPQTLLDLDALPRTGSGAIDRDALPNPFGEVAEVAVPTTPAEKAIADLWRELLGVDEVGRYDNFFDIGGHSLLSARLIARIAKQLGVRLQHADIVASTLQQLAAKCTPGGARPPGGASPSD